MKKGERVLFVAGWSSYRSQRGEVTRPPPDLRVRVDGEALDIAVRTDEVIPERESVLTFTGAE